MTMLPSHLSQAVVCAVLLLAVCHASPCLEDPRLLDPILQNTCPTLVQVGQNYCTNAVSLQETLEVFLKPNLPQMYLEFKGYGVMYEAMVDGTYLKLLECDEDGFQCTTIDEGGSKSSDLLMVNKWNKILIHYINGVITLDVNMKANVMGGNLRLTKGSTKSTKYGQVSFLVPPTAPSYLAKLKITCANKEVPPLTSTKLPITTVGTTATTTVSTTATTTVSTTATTTASTTATTTVSTTATTTASTSASPFQACPAHQVEVEHPLIPVPLSNHLTLAVYPTYPILGLIIANDYLYMKVHVKGSTAKLLKCGKEKKHCSTEDASDNKELLIQPEHWNFVKVTLIEEKMILSINNTEVLMANLHATNHTGLMVSVEIPLEASYTTGEQIVVLVKINCGESTPEPDASGISRDVAIVVGVLVGVLLIIALAIIVTSVKKRRKATLSNERTPLEDQCQQRN